MRRGRAPRTGRGSFSRSARGRWWSHWGAQGALVADGRTGTVVLVPSPRVDAVDTTGAGDAFTAALAWRLSLGEDLATAAAFAVRVGAAAVTREGAQASFPTAEEVSAL